MLCLTILFTQQLSLLGHVPPKPALKLPKNAGGKFPPTIKKIVACGKKFYWSDLTIVSENGRAWG